MDTFKKLEKTCDILFKSTSYEEALAYAEQEILALLPKLNPETNEWVVFEVF